MKKFIFSSILVSMVISTESFAIRSISQDQSLERHSHRRLAKPIQRTAQAPARRAIAQKRLTTRGEERRALPINTRRNRVVHQRTTQLQTRSRPPKQITNRVGNNSRTHNVDVGTRSRGTIKQRPLRVNAASTGIKGDSYVNINGEIIRGKNVSVNPDGNGSYIIDIDGVRRVVDKPVAVSYQTTSSSSTKSRNGHIKSQNNTNHTTYSFMTQDNKNPSFNEIGFQKAMAKMIEDVQKAISELNKNSKN